MVKYVIISPVRNEERYIEKTLNSVVSQTVLPVEWVIVNDGSRDNTEKIIERYSRDNSWIRIVNKKDRGFTQVGKGVIEAFNEGFRALRRGDWEYIVKMDCDIVLEKEYFEILTARFSSDGGLGIAGGTSYAFEKGRLSEERMPKFHPWAGARAYRRKCFEDISGLIESLGWDTVDLLRAQMKGWGTARFEDLKITHLRRMSSRKGLWEGKVRLGRNFYITGYHPAFLFARSLYRLFQKPYVVESAGVLYGYFKAMSGREDPVVTKEEGEFLQRQQLRRLFRL